MRLSALFAAAFAAAFSLPAHSAPVDLSKPYGDKRGCEYLLDQQYSEEFLILLTATEMTTTASLCTFTRTETNNDGSLTLIASCAEEGEAGETPATFAVKRGDKPDSLVVFNEDNSVFGEVSLCK